MSSTLPEWAASHEPLERAFIDQCFKFWNGTNGGIKPTPPPGMSKSKAEVLFYHTKALNNGQKGRRKMERNDPTSIRISEKVKRQLAFEAAELDISLSEFIIRCIIAGRPIVRQYCQISKQFDESLIVIQDEYNSRNGS